MSSPPDEGEDEDPDFVEHPEDEHPTTDDVFASGPLGSSDDTDEGSASDTSDNRTSDSSETSEPNETSESSDTSDTSDSLLPDREYPDHIEKVHEALIGLRDRLYDERFYSEDRDELTTEIGYLFNPIDRLTIPNAEFAWIEPYEKPTADELAEIVEQKIPLITRDTVKHWPPDPDDVQPILDEVEKVKEHINRMDKFPYAYTELEVKERYGKEDLISVGIPDHAPDGEPSEEWYAGLRGVNTMCLIPRENPDAALHIGTDTRTGYDVSIDKENLFVHRAIFGQTGKGKSTLLTNNFRSLMETGAGGCFIDPKGDDSLRLLQILPEDRLDDVIWIEPSAAGEYISGFNFISTNVSPDAPHYDTIVSNLVEDMVKVLSAEDTWHTRMDRVARTLITVMNEYNRRTPDDILDLNFVDMYYILKDEGSRHEFRALIEQTDIQFKSEYLDEIAEMDDEMLEPLLGRFLKWIQENTARRMIGFREESINLSEAVEEDKIVIVRMGMENKRMKKMVGTAISLNAAMQYPGQVRSDVMDGVLNNAKTVHGYNPGRAKSAKAYNTELGIDVDTLTAEADYHQWMRVDTNDGMERSDAFRVYTHPPFPPLRSRERAKEIREDKLEEHGRKIPTKETEKARLLFNEGKGRWEHGGGQRLAMVQDEEEKLMMMQQLLMEAPNPSELPINDTAGGELHETQTSGPTFSDAARMVQADDGSEIRVEPESVDNVLEAIFSVRVQRGNGPKDFVPMSAVKDELETRHGELGYINKLGAVLEKIEGELIKQAQLDGGIGVRLLPDGRGRVLDHDSGANASGGGVKHRYLCGEAFLMASVLGFQANVPSQDADGELPDVTGEPPIGINDASSLTEAERLKEKLQEEYPAVAKLTDGRPLTMEIETSTFDKPKFTISNLRKAVNVGRFCLFVVPDGTNSEDVPETFKDDSFDYYAQRVERLLYDTSYDQSAGTYEFDRSEIILAKRVDEHGNRTFYNENENYRTAEHHRVLREEPDGRGDTIWREDGDEIYAEDKTNGELARLDGIDQALNPPLSKVTYLEQTPDGEWVVRADDNHTYGSEGEALDDYTPYRAPYIPDAQFDSWPTSDDFAIVIMPEDGNEKYDQPHLYIEGDLYPIYDYLGEDLEPPAVDIGDVDDNGEDSTTSDADGQQPPETKEEAVKQQAQNVTATHEQAEPTNKPDDPDDIDTAHQDTNSGPAAPTVAPADLTFEELYQQMLPDMSEGDMNEVRAAVGKLLDGTEGPDSKEEAGHRVLTDRYDPEKHGPLLDPNPDALLNGDSSADSADSPETSGESGDADGDDKAFEQEDDSTESPETSDESDDISEDDDALEDGSDSAEPPHIVGPEELSPAALSQQMKPHLTESDIDEIKDRAYEVFQRDGPPNDEHKVEHEVLSNYYDPDEHGTLINPDAIPDEADPTERPETAALTNAELRDRLPLTESQRESIGYKIREHTVEKHSELSADEIERRELLRYYDPEEHDLTGTGRENGHTGDDSGSEGSQTDTETVGPDNRTRTGEESDNTPTSDSFSVTVNTDCRECNVADWVETEEDGLLQCGGCGQTPMKHRCDELREELDRF